MTEQESRPVTPVSKIDKEPILTLQHASSGSKVTLIGVSHGSAASANLVSEQMKSIKPDAVIVELCEDRILSISLESKIEPIYNRTLNSMYKMKQKQIEDKRSREESEGQKRGILQRTISTFRFAQTQGLFGGVVLIMGLMISALQKATRDASLSDEFVTSMTLANEMKIPVILGDAPQNDTLKSIQALFTIDTLNPRNVIEGAASLGFSAFGAFPQVSINEPEIIDNIDKNILHKSRWINIPVTYVESTQMFTSVIPILLVSTIPTLLATIAVGDDAGSSITSASNFMSTMNQVVAEPSSFLPTIAALFHSSPPPLPSEVTTNLQVSSNLNGLMNSYFETFENVIDVISLFVLVRMAKLIGADRDVIIAEKIDEACRKYPKNSEFVVVIGMLHCNGVARRLLSSGRMEE